MKRKLKTKPLSEQVIVITGASSGIGLATATKAAIAGAKVVISSRNTEDLEQIAKDLRDQGCEIHQVTADVTSYADLVRLKNEAVTRFGQIDTWINNAGGSIYGPILEIPENEERQMFENNFWGVRHGCHIAVNAMKDAGGVIINLGSEVSERSIPLQGLYSASKHAVKAYTDALRMELEKDGVPISVCLIRPTAIDTPFPLHAVNHLRSGEPSLPDPVYSPEVVADAILRCAVSPQRDIFVGAPAKVTAMLESLFTRLMDFMLENESFEKQTRGTSKPHLKENEGVTHAPEHEGQLRGGHIGKVRRSSPFTAVSRLPWRTIALAGLGVMAWRMLSARPAPVERHMDVEPYPQQSFYEH